MMAQNERTLIASPSQIVTFGRAVSSNPVRHRFREFKRFARFIATYDDGHVIIGRAYPDGHFEYQVKVR